MPLDEKDCAAIYKVLVLGEHSVGKTAMLDKLTGRNVSTSILPTVGPDFVKRIFEVDGALVQLMIWDTPGQARFRSITRQQYRNVQGIVLVYDVTNIQSFTHLQYWMDSIQDEMKKSQKPNQYEPIPVVLCGNKADMPDKRQVETWKGEKLATDQMCFEFYETSARTGTNIFSAFHRLAFHITDIFQPQLMKSYHPYMIRPNNSRPLSARSTQGRKRKWIQKKRKQNQKTPRCTFLSDALCCIRQKK